MYGYGAGPAVFRLTESKHPTVQFFSFNTCCIFVSHRYATQDQREVFTVEGGLNSTLHPRAFKRRGVIIKQFSIDYYRFTLAPEQEYNDKKEKKNKENLTMTVQHQEFHQLLRTNGHEWASEYNIATRTTQFFFILFIYLFIFPSQEFMVPQYIRFLSSFFSTNETSRK